MPSRRLLTAVLTCLAALAFCIGLKVILPLSTSTVEVLKLLVGAAALALTIVSAKTPQGNQSSLPSQRSGIRSATLTLGLVGLLGYWNWGAFHYPGFIHRHEMFHYFIGAKHAPELRYTRIYDCILQAWREQQPDQVHLESLRVQDLASNKLVFASTLEDRILSCPSHFSPERWQIFKRDVLAMREISGEAIWNDSLIDFGFNPPPVWNIIPGAITRDLELNSNSLLLVALIDPALILVGFSFVAWAFGLEIGCFAVCFFGIFFPSRFFWNGGAFMRLDWLACLLVGLSLLKRGFAATSGFFLACSGLLRLFPFAFLVFPIARGITDLVRRQRVDHSLLRLCLGAAVAFALLIPLGARSMGGFSAYREFLDNTAKHLSSPFINNIGLASLMSFRPRPDFSPDLAHADLTEKIAAYNEMRRAAFSTVRPLFVAAVLGFFALALWCLRHEHRVWVLAIFGFTLVPIGANLACYYYSFLVAATLLLREAPRIVSLLFFVAVVSQALALGTSSTELLFAAISLVVLYFVVESLLAYRPRSLNDTPKASAREMAHRRS